MVRRLEPGDPRHGTTNGYGNYHCRCTDCREANRLKQVAYVAAVRARGEVVADHGTTTAYSTGCRCEVCKAAHALRLRTYMHSRTSARSSE